MSRPIRNWCTLLQFFLLIYFYLEITDSLPYGELGPSIKSDYSPCAELQVVTQPNHHFNGFLPRPGKEPAPFLYLDSK